MSRNYSSTIVAVIVVLFKFSGIRNGMFFDGWLAYGKIPRSGSKQWCIAVTIWDKKNCWSFIHTGTTPYILYSYWYCYNSGHLLAFRVGTAQKRYSIPNMPWSWSGPENYSNFVDIPGRNRRGNERLPAD